MIKTKHRARHAFIATLLATGLAFSITNVAHAATATYYPISSGTIENGYFRGSYTAAADRSYITLSSTSSTTECYAKQDGNTNPAYQKGGPGQGCTAVQTGTTLTVGDYVKYVVS
ncbi:hypothetical protein [Bifidobacterium cuniculi]|uniref:Uncharacterized protein n=1 Tax=Bifidobacterium cuniculi TaxID=1688 RepID=A0A087AZR1_9BIFI|nr:hypothetical protein [Bifidobacterium cuniculi]KFI64261.1 hypothetical protein BCUN_2126 [Bifidobacterium cuniculi]